MLIYDQKTFNRPFGEPSPGQDTGTLGERLIECAGRVCYDSYGRGRDSGEYHKHILEVGHGSVWEHYNITILVDTWMIEHLMCRPGVWMIREGDGVRVTYNPRVALHWLGGDRRVRDTLLHALDLPQIVERPARACWYEHCEPVHDEEKWVSLYLTGSRGFSHELVRHGDRTAISQRSTRYVDESKSPWMLHPLLASLMVSEPRLAGVVNNYISTSQSLYETVVELLETENIPRKQARGAARGLLGNALRTELVFSASVAQWKRMIAQRLTPFADQEIHDIFRDQVLPSLRSSQYADQYTDDLTTIGL